MPGCLRAHQPREPPGHGNQQLVADRVPVAVIDPLEAVEVGEQYRRRAARTLGALRGVLEPLPQQEPVRQAGQRVVQSTVPKTVTGLGGLLACLGVQHVGRGDIGQCPRRCLVAGIQGTWGIPVEVQSTQSAAAVPQWEREHRSHPRRQRRRSERGEAAVGGKVGNCYSRTRLIRRDARPLTQLGLQLLETQRGRIRSGDIMRSRPRRDQRHPGTGNWQHLDDPLHQIIEDPLNREVRDHRACELAEHRRQSLFTDNTSAQHETGPA